MAQDKDWLDRLVDRMSDWLDSLTETQNLEKWSYSIQDEQQGEKETPVDLNTSF